MIFSWRTSLTCLKSNRQFFFTELGRKNHDTLIKTILIMIIDILLKRREI